MPKEAMDIPECKVTLHTHRNTCKPWGTKWSVKTKRTLVLNKWRWRGKKQTKKWKSGFFLNCLIVIDNFTVFSDWSFSAPHLLLDPVAPGFLVALGPPFLQCLLVVLSDLLIHHDPAEL